MKEKALGKYLRHPVRKIIKEFFTVPVDCPASTATQMRKMYKVVITNSSITDYYYHCHYCYHNYY